MIKYILKLIKNYKIHGLIVNIKTNEFLYYGYLNIEIPGYWILFDPSFGFYLPLVAGIVGIIGAAAAAYASSVESKFPAERLITESVFKPQPVNRPTIETEGLFQSQHETPKFCGNCGEKLIGPFCKVCGTKAES